MAQHRIKINGQDIFQPDEDLTCNFETTYTEDSSRTQDGIGHFTPLFTVEQFGYKATNIPVSEASDILRVIALGGNFTLHYFSPFYGAWRDDIFYVGKGSLNVGRLKEGEEFLSSLSFNMTGVNPL